MAWVRARFCKLQKGCTGLAAANDKFTMLGGPASSSTKTGRHDIAEILLKVALNTKNQIKIKSYNRFLSFNVISYYCFFAPLVFMLFHVIVFFFVSLVLSCIF